MRPLQLEYEQLLQVHREPTGYAETFPTIESAGQWLIFGHHESIGVADPNSLSVRVEQQEVQGLSPA